MTKYSGVCSVLGGLAALGALGGCSGPPSGSWAPETLPAPDTTTSSNGLRPLFEGKTRRADSKVAPVAGGTLLITKDGHAVASDPDRDLVHVVDLAKQTVVSVPIAADDEPGRVVEGPPGTVYVAARRGGVVLAVDTAQGSARRLAVCSAPRGLAYDATLSRLYVACRSGVLAVIDTETDAIIARHHLDADLRDVLLSGDNLVVTRFKSAELLVVGRDGSVLRRSPPGARSTNGASVTPAVAYRALGLPGGGVLVGHVESSNVTLPSGAGAYYGAFCGGSVADLGVSAMDPYSGADHATLTALSTNTLGGATGPLDLALTPDGARVAMLATGNAWSPTVGQRPPNMWIANTSAVKGGTFTAPCGGVSNDSNTSTVTAAGEPVAVAFDTGGHWVVQSREPAQLQLEQGAIISLAADSRFDTGFAMFHMNTGGGIACTSCHPEAGEDGHTWNFSVGPRRSQTLEGGASARAPFHWSGDLVTFDNLVDEVMLKRMSLPANVDTYQRAALKDWLDSVPKAATADDLDISAVARGRALFEDQDLACATCHSGADFTDNLPHDVGTGAGAAFITPSLVDVNIRAPLFHDGCALTLEGRFGPCGGGDAHGKTSKLTRADEADLVAFMQSL